MKITIEIPRKLKEEVEEKLKETDFKSINDYFLYFLEQLNNSEAEEIYSEHEMSEYKKNPAIDAKDEGYTKEEEEGMKESLRKRGYI